MPIQSQGIITRDNVSVDVSAVAYFRVVDAVKSVVAIENVNAAIDQIAQTTLRKVVGQHTLDETLVGDRPDQPRHPRDPRHHHRRLGRRGHPRRAQGHPAAGQHEAGDGTAGRGRAGEARQDHQRRGRVPGRRRPRRRLGHDDGPPPRAAAPEPAEPGRDRRRQEHHRRLPGAADEHDRRARRVPGEGSRPPWPRSMPSSTCRRGRTGWPIRVPLSPPAPPAYTRMAGPRRGAHGRVTSRLLPRVGALDTGIGLVVGAVLSSGNGVHPRHRRLGVAVLSGRRGRPKREEPVEAVAGPPPSTRARSTTTAAAGRADGSRAVISVRSDRHPYPRSPGTKGSRSSRAIIVTTASPGKTGSTDQRLEQRETEE